MKIKILPVLLFFLILLSCDSFAVTATSFNGTGQQIIENTWEAGFASANSILANENAYPQYLDIIDDMSSEDNVFIMLIAFTSFPQSRTYEVRTGFTYSGNPARW